MGAHRRQHAGIFPAFRSRDGKAEPEAPALGQLDCGGRDFWCWYGSRFPDPVATVYGNSLEKIAAQKVRRVELDDASYSESDFVVLLEHAKEKIASVYGEEVFDKILESPIERYSALPSHHRNAVKRLLLSA